MARGADRQCAGHTPCSTLRLLCLTTVFAEALNPEPRRLTSCGAARQSPVGSALLTRQTPQTSFKPPSSPRRNWVQSRSWPAALRC